MDADEALAEGVRHFLDAVDPDYARDGLDDTPGRVVKAWREMTEGYGVDVEKLLAVQFDEHSDQVVIVRGVEFVSLCEHHLLPFVGTATVAYLPGPRVVGLSKLARLVDAYARRLQVQERLTTQIAEAIMDHLDALGAAVVVRAAHSCMGCRGVRKPTAEMVTSSMLGAFRLDATLRAEFFSLDRT